MYARILEAEQFNINAWKYFFVGEKSAKLDSDWKLSLKVASCTQSEGEDKGKVELLLLCIVFNSGVSVNDVNKD